MSAASVLLCTIVGALILPEPALVQAFLEVPGSLNVTVGAMAEFFCRKKADAVGWTVNDASLKDLNDSNIAAGEGSLVDGVSTGTLRILADVRHNNSVVHCVSFTIGEGETSSGPAILMVQGLLSAPTNMQATRPNSSAIQLNWDPPFTLDITNVELDISGYTVSITNNNTKVTSKRNVTKPEFLFQEEGHDACHVYLFNVSALNPVGVGNTSVVMDKCFGEAPQSANVNWTMRDSSVETQIILQLIITYDMSCHGRRPEDIDIYIIMTDGSRMQMDPPPTLFETGRLDLELDFSVDNAPCDIQVTIMNQFGNNLTEIMIDENCQLIGTDDITEESSPENNLVIPIVVGGICGAVLVIVVVAILIVIFVKFRGEHESEVDIEDFAAKDNQYTDVPTKANIAHNTGRQTSSHSTGRQSSSSSAESSIDSQTPLVPNRMETDSQTPLLPNRVETASQPPIVPSHDATPPQPPIVPSREPTASQPPIVPSREPTASQPPIVPSREPTPPQPPFVPSRKATASQPPFVPSREPTASQPPFVPSREPTPPQPPFVPSRKATASQPPFVPSRKATASQPPFVPSREPTDSQPPFVPSREPTDSQKNSELQYAVIATPQLQPQAPVISQRVAYALLQPQDTKASTEHEN